MTSNIRQDEIQQALEQWLHAAVSINNPDGNSPRQTLEAHNNAMRDLVLQAWQELAVLTGNRDLAERKGFAVIRPERPVDEELPFNIGDWTQMQNNQPIVPFHQLNDPLTAMGAAMFHAGAAAVQYGLILDFPGTSSGGCSNADRYLWAENDARIAHALLHRTYMSLSNGHPHGSDIRKHCRQANLWLTRERSQAAAALGIHPPPKASDDLQHGELDYDGRNAGNDPRRGATLE